LNARILDERGWPCPTGAEMGAIDRDAIRAGLPGRVLMETAGRAVAAAVWGRFPRVRRPLVVCGGGNNGGDGYVVARVLREHDDRVEPVVLVLGERERHSEEARANLDLLAAAGVETVALRDLKPLEHWLPRCDLIVDAVFGVGLARAVEGRVADVLQALWSAELPVVAVDLPSGLSSDTGAALGPEPRADLIVTLGLPKLGLALRPDLAPVLVADIGLPPRDDMGQFVLTDAAVRRLLPERVPGGHKGTFGHVLVVAGSPGKTGAAVLATRGALRAGAGLATLAAIDALNPVYESQLVEAMTLPVGKRLDARTLAAAADARDALVVGPGLGTERASVELVAGLLDALDKPAVVDADGLNAFAGRVEALRGPGPRVLTPHPGEAARLLGRGVGDRVADARELAQRSGGVCVLKGARTVVAAPDGAVRVNPTGGPGLASGGTGDVLAGVIGALLAQGLTPLDAAAAGVYLHGRAGELGGPVGALAGEVAERIPAVWRRLTTPDSTEEPDPDVPGGLRRFP
jgi:NAD(P)H-hydrate epimerase